MPDLLYGYGGFAVPMTPFYLARWAGSGWSKAACLCSAAFAAAANLARIGTRALAERRQVAFDDFLAIARQLIADGVTCPARLGIQGGSNGGLLVAAAMTQAPELFGAVVCEVPLTDMLRYTELSAGRAGSTNTATGRPCALRRAGGLSPHQHLHADVRYPATLVTTSSSDDRVHPGHARKFTARASWASRCCCISPTPAGHSGQGGDMRQLAAEAARVTVFCINS